jgi:thioredoxin-related protein
MSDTEQTAADVVPRRGTSGRLIGLFVLIAGLYWIVGRPVQPPAGWGADVAVAMNKARAEGRRLLIAFHQPGCPPCAAMDRDVLGDSDVQKAIAPFVPVRVDVQKDSELANQLGVFGTPTYAVVDPDGTMVTRTEGFQPVEAFVRFLERAARIP